MPLAPGSRLGPYEILTPIGKGGMGEVFRARDTKLDRDVAVKVLPDALARDPERLARFEREAKALAALNHPNIAQIYAVEGHAIVMELVPGSTLAALMALGPLPLDQVLDYAAQMAAALEAAHDKSIVHRDLKPGNVMVTPDGQVKVLDFGLVGRSGTTDPGHDPDASPTLTLRATQAGVIMGTAAYMAPEQASGKTVDKRADIWSFGVIVWELLTGRRLFEGETISHVLAAVLTKDPDLTAVPDRVRPMLVRCLEKDPKKRLRDIGDALHLVPAPGHVPAPAVARSARRGWVAAALATAAVALVALGYVAFQPSREEPPRVIRFSISPPGKGALAFNGPTISVSPDGRKIVFAAAVEGSLALWLRDLDASTARMLAGTEGGNTSFWAPDSRRLAFNAGGKLKKIDVAGGPPITLADASNATGSWSSSDEILFADSTRAVSRIAARGGMPVPVTQIDQKAPLNGHLQPWFLPGGRDFLFTKFTSEAGKFGVYVGALDAPNDPQNSPLLAGVSNVVYAPPGYLLFVRERSLMAQPFDAGKRILSGEAVPLVEQVYENSVSGRQGFGYFAASQNGVLAYATSRDTGRIQLTWFDREGKNLGTVGPPGDLEAYTLAPDGNSVVVAQRDTQSGRFDLWRHDLVRGGQSRLTFAESNRYPVFSADGSRVFFTREDEGKATTLSVAANGSGQPESVDDTRRLLASDASRDGRYLISNTGTNDRKQLNDLWVQPLFGDKKSFPYLATEFNETGARISPDGGWLAYQSNESKRDEVYVISFPMRGGKWQISTGGGSDPMWSRDGRELYFYSAGREIMAVDIRAGEQFSAGIPRPLFKANLSTTNNRFNVGKDGRFLLPVLLEQAASTPIEVIVNWPELLKR